MLLKQVLGQKRLCHDHKGEKVNDKYNNTRMICYSSRSEVVKKKKKRERKLNIMRGIRNVGSTQLLNRTRRDEVGLTHGLIAEQTLEDMNM